MTFEDGALLLGSAVALAMLLAVIVSGLAPVKRVAPADAHVRALLRKLER